MSPSPEAKPYGVVLAVLRVARGMSQKELARVADLKPTSVSKLERAVNNLKRRRCEELVMAMGYPRTAVDEALVFIARMQEGASRSARLGLGTADDEVLRSIDPLVSALEKKAGEFARAWFEGITREGLLLDAKRRGAGLRARLLSHPPEARLALVREVAEFQDWALSAALSDESESAAPHSADEALALAELAVEVARRVPGEAGWRSRVEGRAGAHLANAWRVAGKLPAADAELARALRLWEAGAASDPGLLDPVRMLDLEASLRKDQRRLPQALDLLDRALASRPAAEVEGRLLIKKGCVLEKLERYQEAIAALERAAPLVEAGGNGRLRFAWRFDLLVNLCHLGRHAEAESRLGDVRALAVRIGNGNGLDGVRLTWLEGRIAAGLGRTEEAIGAFERVRAELTTRRIAYDTALVILDIAILLAEQGRTAEVRELAQQAAWIFETQDVHREALRALGIFRGAATRERLSADLARNIGRFLRRAENDPRLRFRQEAA
jgi:tetratricopeptide (TPR) repeat protein/DNA-binding XRE family transcriptional regulator